MWARYRDRDGLKKIDFHRAKRFEAIVLKYFSLILFCAMALAAPLGIFAETLVCERDKTGNNQFGDVAGFYMSFYEKFRNDRLFAETRSLSPGELECLIEPSAFERTGEDRPLLVDIRDQSRFEKYRIQNSINIPWHQLKRKAFLKEKHIVLIGEGYRYIELLENCAELKKTGFEHVSVLQYGLNSQLPVRHSLNEIDYSGEWISPQEFYILKFKGHWIVVDVSGSKDSEGVVGSLYRMDLSDEDQKLREKLQAILATASGKQTPHSNFLIIGRSGEEYGKIQGIVSEKYRPYVYYLKGGLEAYNSFIILQQRLIDQKKRMRNKGMAKCGG